MENIPNLVPEPGKEDNKSEHLKEGIRPIMACVGMPEHFGKNMPGSGKTHKIRNVDYYDNPYVWAEQEFKNDGKNSYAISTVDSLDKFSVSFRNCTGIIVASQDEKTGTDISFLSHQDPNYFLTKNGKKKFINDLRHRLLELKKRSAEKTIDAVIVGGNYLEDGVGEHDNRFKKNYLKSIKLLSAEIQKILGFEPLVMTGPKMTDGQDNVFYDNNERKLYIIRPEVGSDSTISFFPSDIGIQKKKWKQTVRDSSK